MRILKLLSVFLAAASLIGFIGVNSPVVAGEGDKPHDTHLVDLKGPGISTADCDLCHTTSSPTPGDAGVDTSACDICHGPGGVFDGVNDTDVGALNNWDEYGDDSIEANESLIYNTDGTLKGAKSQWCATCHDQDPSETGTLVDDFQSYGSSAALRTDWKRGGDARRPFFVSSGGQGGSKGMRAKLEWDKKTKKYGVVKRIFSTPLDLRGTDAISFYVKISKVRRIRGITVKLRKLSDGQFSKASFETHDLIVDGTLENRKWFLVMLPRASFSDTTWGEISEIQFQIKEKKASDPSYTANVNFDNIRAIKAGANVVGDNTTYGFYVTGHGTVVNNCTRCHDPASDHLDGDTRPIFDYIKDVDNPTYFRFYRADPTLTMQLPYTQYIEGTAGSFALCYTCHDEACITQDEPAEQLNTNFTDYGWIAQGKDNLHLEHVGGPGSNMPAEVFHGSCVLCHDPHGQSNPAMTRREMGNFIYFDTNGCEIERGADTDSDDLMDWYDPDVNMGGAQTEGIFTFLPDMCITCHLAPAPPDDPCSSGPDPYVQSGGMDGWYERTHKDTCAVTFATQAHSTHTTDPKGPLLGEDEAACDVCHGVTPLKDACTDCHSPGGAFDGVDDSVVGAWTNWAAGVYEFDGTTIQSGKEDWCLSCHDDDPGTAGTNESALIDGVYAPNIAGDENNGNTYGFNITGHDVNYCLECHDANKGHIDGDARTYQANVTEYTDSYRLMDIQGLPALNLPRTTAILNVPGNWPDFALCLDCHSANRVLGQSVSDTNFWNDDASDSDSHFVHLRINSGHFDSDWNGTADSTENCTACHNVHGPPTVATRTAMVRHGELISTPGTTDKVPALNFSYLTTPIVPTTTATWTFTAAQDGSYKVYAWWKAASNRATDAPYTIYYNGGSQTIRVNQEINGGQFNQLGTGTFPFVTTASGSVVLGNDADEFVFADAIKIEGAGPSGTDIILNDDTASYVSNWTYVTGNTGSYNLDSHYHARGALGTPTPNTTLQSSVMGFMDYGIAGVGKTIADNGVCNACHPAISYIRTPSVVNLYPMVIRPRTDPDTVPNDGTGTTLITASVYDSDSDFSGDIKIDLSSIGGSAIQPMYDNGTNGDVTGGDGVYSYLALVTSGTLDSVKYLVITTTDDAANTGQGRGSLSVVEPGSIYLDNPGAEFVCTSWTTVSNPDALYGHNHSYIAAGSGSCTATWNIPAVDGDYKVYAWWKAASNRATDAPYTINYDGGSQTVDVNQEINGSQWNLLGTFPFDAGTAGSVVLSDNANEIAIADAIKLEPTP